jgi:hypothetical protein
MTTCSAPTHSTMRMSTARAVATQPCVTAATPITYTTVTSTTRTKVMSTST